LYWSRSKEVIQFPEGAKAPPKASAVLGKAEKDEIDLLIRQAEQSLKSSQVVRGARIAKLPVVFLIGEAGAGKTTTVLKSGLEPEALAGQATQDDSIVPTQWANLWFTCNTVFVEAGNKVSAEAPPWARLVRHVAPAKLGSVLGRQSKAARAAVVCLDCEPFTKPDSSQALLTSARNLRARLAEMSQLLGISFPVYVLFTKADRIKFFDDYVKNFSGPEIAQILGVTLPLQSDDVGIYAEQQTKRVSSAFDDLLYSLSDKRIEFLPREYVPERWPGIYEFPREFRRLQTPIVQFLVELCRPSQLSIGPFLRGFYFTGRRTVVVEIGASAQPQPSSPLSEVLDESPGATRVFDMKNVRRPAVPAQPAEEVLDGATRVFDARKPPLGGALGGGALAGGTLAGGTFMGGFTAPPVTRTEQQWVFLSHLFSDVVLQDHTALGASGTSSKVSFWQRFLLATAAALFMVCAIGFIVSYFRNRALESEVKDARAISVAELPANQSPSVSDLNRLNAIGQPLHRLSDYRREGAPYSLRWGLYTGEDLYPLACRAYANAFDKLLLRPTQTSIVAYLKGLVYKTPYDPALDPYDRPYTILETYLITTGDGRHAKEDASLSSDLYAEWSSGRTVDPDQERLAKAEFEFYSAELAAGSPASCLDGQRDASAVNTVNNARAYLNNLPPDLRIYQAMLSDAASQVKGIDFNKQFADQVVTDGYPIRPAFTKDGWTAMQNALQNPARYGTSAGWVLGEQLQQAKPQIDQAALQQRYHKEFVSEWRSFMKAARFKNSPGMIDAVIGARSALLMVFCLVARNTAEADADVKDAFSVPRAVVPPNCATNVLGQENKEYRSSLDNLQTCLQKADLKQAPQDKAAAKLDCQSTAIDASKGIDRLVRENAGTLSDPDVNKDSKKLLLYPIEALQGQMKAPPPAGAGDLCKGLGSLSGRFPGQVTLDEFEAIFRPADGQLGKFKPPTEKANPRYVNFYNKAIAIQKALYPDTKTLQLHYTVTALDSPGVNSFNLTIGNQSLTAFGIPKDFVWRGDAQESVQLTVPGISSPPVKGFFDIFRFVADLGENGRLRGENYSFAIKVILGKETATSPRLNLVINAGAASELFQSGAPGNLGCTAKMEQ